MERANPIPCLALVVALAAAACAPHGSNDDASTGAEQNLDECTFGAKGWDCSASGTTCKAKCYSMAEPSRAYVAFTVDGKTLDSRAVPYAPAAATLDNVLVYGCTLWDFADGTHQGLDFEYKRLIHGAFGADRRSDFEDYVNVSIASFEGPGSYRADPTYIPSDEAQALAKIYARPAGCGVEVSSDGDGGVTGMVACAPMSAPDGTTVSLRGEFACPGSALSPLYSRLP